MNELPATVAAATLARLLGLSTRRLQQLAEAQVIPKPATRGHYRLAESVNGYVTWLRSDEGAGTPDFQKERARLTQARARLAELEFDRESGLVVEIAESIKQIGIEYAAVRSRLLAIPNKVAPRAALLSSPDEVRALIEVEVVEALKELTAASDDQAATAARGKKGGARA